MPGWKRMSLAAQMPAGAHELLVEAAERRAAIAGDIAGGVEAGAAVALLLHQAEAHERLKAGDEDPALGEVVFVVEGDVSHEGLYGLFLVTAECRRGRTARHSVVRRTTAEGRPGWQGRNQSVRNADIFAQKGQPHP